MSRERARTGAAHAPAPAVRPRRRTSYPNLQKLVNTSDESWPSDGQVISCAVPADEWPAWTDQVAFSDFPHFEAREGR